MPDGNVPLPNAPLDSSIDPPAQGAASPSPKTTKKDGPDPKKQRQRAEETFTDGKKFHLFEAAIAGIEADARQKGGLSKYDVAIIRNLQRDMLAIGQNFIKRGNEDRTSALESENGRDPGTKNVDQWKRISKGIEETLAVNPGFDEREPQYARAGKGYKKNLLFAARSDLQKGAERAGNNVGSTTGQREQVRQEKDLLMRGRSFVQRDAYTERLPNEIDDLPPMDSEDGAIPSARITEAVTEAEHTDTKPEPVRTPIPQPSAPASEPITEAEAQAVEDPVTEQAEAPETEPDSESNTEEESTAPDTGAGSVIAALGAPIATSVVGAIAARRNQVAEPTNDSEDLEKILKDLDTQEDTLIERIAATQQRKTGTRLDAQAFQEQVDVAHKQLAIEQKRLELLRTHQTLPGLYGSVYDQKTLEENIQKALANIDDRSLALVHKQYEDALPAEQATQLNGLFDALDQARLASVQIKAGVAAKTRAEKQVATIREQIKTFQEQHPLTIKTTQTQTTTTLSPIAQARTELRQNVETKKYQAQILELYEARLRERSVQFLETHHPQQFAEFKALQSQTTTVTLDATSLLNSAEQRSLQLEVLVDVKAVYPDITDELLSALLLAKAATLLAQTDALEKQATLRTIASFLEGNTGKSPGEVAARFAPMAIGLLNEVRATQDDLRNEERGILARAEKIHLWTGAQTAAPSSSPDRTRSVIENTQKDQQNAFARRRGLQATLHGQMAALRDLQALTLPEGTGQSPAIALSHGTAFVNLLSQSHHTSVPLPKTTAPRAPAPGRAVSVAPLTTQTPSDAEQVDVDAHQAAIASRLSSNQIRDRHLGGQNRSSSSRSTSEGQSFSGGTGEEEEPLLALPVKPKNAKQQFAEDQRAMKRQTRSLIGGVSGAGGYEDMFSEGTETQQTTEDQASWLNPDDVQTIDEETGGEMEENAEAQAEYEAQQASQMMQQQQQAAQEAQQNQQGPQQPSANGIKKLAESPAGKKAIAQGMKLLANPATIVLLVIIVAVWLNIRFFLPKEDSFLRKPLGALGKMGTIALDILLVILIILSLVMLVMTVVILFLPILLPLGGIFAILQGAINIFGG